MVNQNEFNSIPWIDANNFSLRVILGSNNVFYNCFFVWNEKGQYWSATISTEDGKVIVEHRKLVLNVDLLENCHSIDKPNSSLVPLTEDERILEISKDAMINKDVKLFDLPYALIEQ